MFTMSDILKWHKRLTPFSDALNINNHLCVLRFLGLGRSPKSLLWLLSVSEELFIKLLLTLLSSSSLLISLINGLVQAFLVCTPEHSPLSLGPEIVRPDPLPLLSPPFFGAPLPCPPLIPLFPPLHLSSSYFGRRIIKGLQYIGARAPLYWSPLTTIFRNIILWLIENHFLSWINPIQMDWVLLNLIGVIAKKYFWFASLLCKKNIWWAPIYWSMGSIILEPRLQFIGAPSVQQTCFLFYFWTWNTANKRFPVH